MKILKVFMLSIGVLSLPAHADQPALPGERPLHYGAPFGDVSLYIPKDKPTSVVLFLSGDGGWHLGVVSMARHLAARGALVVGLDVRHYLADIGAHAGVATGTCRYLAADFETLGHRIQRELELEEYHVPLLYGYSSGATIAYAALVQSPPGTFGGAVSLGFCPDQKFGGTPLCPGPEGLLTYKPGLKGAVVFDPALKLKDRWIAFQGQADRTCVPGIVDIYATKVGGAEVVRLDGVGHGFGNEKKWVPQLQQTLEELAPSSPSALAGTIAPAARTTAGASAAAATTVPPTAPAGAAAIDVGDLPLVELPVTRSGNDAHSGSERQNLTSPPFVIMLSGDGGWAGLDKGVAAEFVARGLPVVGVSTLKYYWKARTPEESARDVARIMRHYMGQWHRQRVLLVGYSFGANVLPFIVNRLPEDLRSQVAGLGLIGLETNTSFEIRVNGWIPGSSSGDIPVRPELEKIQGLRTACVYARGEKYDPCPKLVRPATQATMGAGVANTASAGAPNGGATISAHEVGQGHHFSGDYAGIVNALLQ